MRSTSCAAERGPERGATVVEFLGVAVLVVLALMTIIQFSLWVWTRNVVVNAADEGARLAAESGRAVQEGEVRTREVLRDGIGGRAATFRIAAVQAGDRVVVRARGEAASVVPFLPALTVEAEAVAFDEDRAGP